MTATAHEHDIGVEPRPRAWVAPVLTGVAGLAGCAFVALRDPSRQGGFVPCPFHAITGWWCPGCGLTRGLHKLLRGDVAGALGSNVFLPVVIVLAGWLWWTWLSSTVGARPIPGASRIPNAVWVGLVALLVVFGVARNLPVDGLRALAP